MSDQTQTETGSDVNALRNNIPLGEHRDFEVTHVQGQTVAARVSGAPDFDADNVNFVPEDYRPEVGVIARFTHVADETRPSGSRVDVSALPAPVQVEVEQEAEVPAVAEEEPAA